MISYYRLQSRNYDNNVPRLGGDALYQLFLRSDDSGVARDVEERLCGLGYTASVSMLDTTYYNNMPYHNERGRLLIVEHNSNPQALSMTVEMLALETNGRCFLEIHLSHDD